MRLFAGIRTRPAVAGMVRGWARSTGLGVGASALRGGALPADDAARKCEFSRSMVGSAGTRQPVESRGHRPAAARAPRTTPGCTCGHAYAPPTASRPWEGLI